MKRKDGRVEDVSGSGRVEERKEAHGNTDTTHSLLFSSRLSLCEYGSSSKWDLPRGVI